MQSLAEDEGSRGGDAAALAPLWGTEQGLEAGTRDWALLHGRGMVCRAGEHKGTALRGSGCCCPCGVSRLLSTWVLPTFLSGFINWGLTSFPARE